MAVALNKKLNAAVVPFRPRPEGPSGIPPGRVVLLCRATSGTPPGPPASHALPGKIPEGQRPPRLDQSVPDKVCSGGSE